MLKRITKNKGDSRSLMINASDSDEDCNVLDSSIPTVKTLHDFEGMLDKLQLLNIREAHRSKRQMELTHTREEIQHSENYTFTAIRCHGDYTPRDSFE